jgi:hypothetical protein
MCLAVPWIQLYHLTGLHHKMAAPNQGPAPVPNPGINPAPNLPTLDIDLSDSTWTSDGQSQQFQTADLTSFLARLSQVFAIHPRYAAILGKARIPSPSPHP